MSKCRATSFYLAPGTRAYFDTNTLATKGPDGAFVAFTHRRDLEAYEAQNPDWDHVCFLGPPGGTPALEEALLTSPERVERYRLDARVINGRSPSGPAQTIYRLHAYGTQKAGGVYQITDALFPSASKPLRTAVQGVAHTPGAGFVLGLSHTLREALGDGRCAALIENSATLAASLALAPIDPNELAGLSPMLTERYGARRAAALLAQLGSVEALGADWHRALATLSPDPEFLRTLRKIVGDVYDYSLTVNVATPPDLLEQLTLGDYLVRQGVAKHPNATPELLEKLTTEEHTDAETLIALASRDLSTLSAATLEALSISRLRSVKIHLARNATLNPELITAMMSSDDMSVRRAIAERHHRVPEVARTLCRDPKRDVRSSIALVTPFADVLETLSRDEYYSVRQCVAENKSAPAAVLATLYESDSDSLDIAFALCENPHTPPDVLEKLSADLNYADRVAKNPSTPPLLLRSLTTNPTFLGATPEMAGLFHDVLRAVALNAHTPPDVLSDLAKRSAVLKVLVAKNSAIDPTLARELFEEAKVSLVPADKQGDNSVQWSEFDSPSWEILDHFASNPATAPDMVAELVENAYSWGVTRVFTRSDIPSALLEPFSLSPDPRTRRHVAYSPSASPQLLRTLSRDPDQLVRREVRDNPATPPEALINTLALSTDPDLLVRAALIPAPAGSLPLRPTHPALQYLREAALVATMNVAPTIWPERPRSIVDLPNRTSLPWNIDDAAKALDGTTITTSEGALTIDVLDSHQRLKTNATYMGNCTAGYASRVASGQSVIVALRSEQRVLYNAEFIPTASGSWEIGEVNSRRNAGISDPSLRGVLEDLAASIPAKS
jgi:hypothetical protein